MGERKVINKYYPPDFDPSKIPRNRKPKHQQINIRMMLPMTIRCVTCYNYIYKGTKFNSRKEDVIGETYLGIPIVRFYLKCTKCAAEIIIKTDPRNDGYVIEAGATAPRNIEPRQAEEIHDPMEGLERRAADANRERHILHTLDELRSMKARRANVSVDAMLEAFRGSATVKQEDTLEGEDEDVIKSIFRGSNEFVRRIDDDELDDYITKKRKLSREFCDEPRDCLMTIVGKAKKREEAGGRIVLKSSTVKFSVVKKLPKA
ncbi:putative CWC16 protein [Helianthus annuus]|nr:putative CWC16 protein [Helianthus annuus]